MGEADLGSFDSMLRLAACAWGCSDNQNLIFSFHKLLQSTNSPPMLFSCSDPDKHYLMYEHERVPIAVCEKEPSSIIAFALRYWYDFAVLLTHVVLLQLFCARNN